MTAAWLINREGEHRIVREDLAGNSGSNILDAVRLQVVDDHIAEWYDLLHSLSNSNFVEGGVEVGISAVLAGVSYKLISSYIV